MPSIKITYNDIVFDRKVYTYCINSKFKCPHYGFSWSCPPAAPFLKEKLAQYSIFFLIFYKLDIKAYIKKIQKKNPSMTEKEIKKSLIQKNYVNMKTNLEINRFIHEYKENFEESLILWPEKCNTCINEGKKCTYEERLPCRYPEDLKYSMTGAGINTQETVKKLNFFLEWPPNNLEYRFGLVCFN